MARKTWDEKLGKYVEGYSGNGSSLNPTASGKVTTTSTKSTPTKTTTKTTNKTYYPDVTKDATTKNVPDTGKWDTSYVQQSAYGREWAQWDYKADVTKDKNRAAQIKANLKNDAISNPKLFSNRADFEKYYHYSERSNSQKQLLNEAWDNYNKYWLNSSENSHADDASKASTDKNNEKMKIAAKTYSDTLPYLKEIRQKLNDRLWPVFDQLQQYQTKYLNDMSELRKLQNDYYAGMKREYDALAAGQSASVGSTLSGQWLSQSAIASTVDWVDKNWQSRYNNLMQEHINTLKWLQDSEQSFMNSYWTLMWNLTNVEQWALNDWLNSFKDLRKNLDDAYLTAIDEKYNPYEVLTKAKVTGWAEAAQSTGKRESTEAEYKSGSISERARMINGYLKSYFWEDADLSKYVPFLEQAAQQNDLTAAMKTLFESTKEATGSAAPSKWSWGNGWNGWSNWWGNWWGWWWVDIDFNDTDAFLALLWL